MQVCVCVCVCVYVWKDMRIGGREREKGKEREREGGGIYLIPSYLELEFFQCPHQHAIPEMSASVFSVCV